MKQVSTSSLICTAPALGGPGVSDGPLTITVRVGREHESVAGFRSSPGNVLLGLSRTPEIRPSVACLAVKPVPLGTQFVLMLGSAGEVGE